MTEESLVDRILSREQANLCRALYRKSGISMKRAYEIFLEDVNGKRYIDFSAGGVTAVGYSHPKVGGGNRASKKRIRSM